MISNTQFSFLSTAQTRRFVCCRTALFLGWIWFLLGSAFAKAQPPQPTVKDSIAERDYDYFFLDGDSLTAIELDDVLLLQRLNFDSKYERIKYRILDRKVKKVWPYARLAADRLQTLDQRLVSLDSKRKRKNYARMVEDYIEKEFTAELKKLSRTEGQILIKLIHRQTGDTAFELIKRLRSGWSAFWFQNTASIFDISLKEEYRPETEVEDFYIEDILLNAFNREELDSQESAVELDYYQGRKKWKLYEKSLPADYDSIHIAERNERIKEYREKKARKAKKEARRKARRDR